MLPPKWQKCWNRGSFTVFWFCFLPLGGGLIVPRIKRFLLMSLLLLLLPLLPARPPSLLRGTRPLPLSRPLRVHGPGLWRPASRDFPGDGDAG